MSFQSGCVAALIGALCVSVAEGAVTFSFLSDDNNDGPTFAGQQAGPNNILNDGADFDASESVVVGLTVDPNGDLPGGGITFDSVFNFSGQTSNYSVVQLDSNVWLHNWVMSGSFTFTDTGTGLTVLEIAFTNAVFSSVSNASNVLGNSAALQANAATDSGLNFVAGAPLIGLGIDNSDLGAGESFAFSLTNLVAPGSPGLSLTLSNGGWGVNWIAEGSFSAAASAVPAPGALAMLVGAMMLGSRRRRNP